MKNESKITDKMSAFYPILVTWLAIKQENRCLDNWFVEKGYKTVAIYGVKELGERLYEELKDSNVKVEYLIDQNKQWIYSEIDVYMPSDRLPIVDVIVVTAITAFDEIKELLSLKYKYPIVSLADIVFSEE